MRRHRFAQVRLLPVIALPLAFAACGGGSPAAPSGLLSSPSSTGSVAASGAAELVADVDIGGRTLHLVCLGPTDIGEPTIVMEGGLGEPYIAWSDVLAPLSATHRVCAYDRAGLGASPPAPEAARTSTDAATDLHALLATAKVAGPFVMVGHSSGAWSLALYMQTYPDDVAGLVFVDPRGPRVSEGWRGALPPVASDEPTAVAANRDELGAFEHDPSMNEEHLDLTASTAASSAALDASGPLFGDRPVVVLSAADTPTSWSDLPPDLGAAFGEIWAAGQQELADESTAGSLVTVADSGHVIQSDQPTAVIEAIEGVLTDLATR